MAAGPSWVGEVYAVLWKHIFEHREISLYTYKKKHRLKGNIRLGSDAIVGTIATIVIIIAASSNLMQYLLFCIPLWTYLATHQIGFLCPHLQSWKLNVTCHIDLFFYCFSYPVCHTSSPSLGVLPWAGTLCRK